MTATPRARRGRRCSAATRASSPASPATPGRTSSAAHELADGQRPRAALFGCSDSRLAAEIIFDKGLGDLFVVRNAGQVISDSVVGSLEYAVAVLGVPLIVVLGHDECGAVDAAIDSTRSDAPALPAAHLAADRADRARRAPRAARDAPWTAVPPAEIDAEHVGREHLRDTVADLLHSSELISDAVADGRLAIVGANYRLAEGTAVPDIIVGVGDRRRLSTDTRSDWRNEDVTDIEYRIEHDTMGEVRVPKDALYAAQTQRAVENFPISGDAARPGADRRARPDQEGRGAREQGARHARRRHRRRDRPRRRPDHRRRVRRPVPDRRLPDRQRHLVEHEHERGARDPRDPRPRLAGAPERPRQRLAVLERRLPDLGAHRRDAGAHRRPDPGARPPRRRARGEGRSVEGRRQVRSHAPHGRDARHPRPGVRRLRPPDAPRHRARAGGAPPRRRGAARRHRRRHRHQHSARASRRR